MSSNHEKNEAEKSADTVCIWDIAQTKDSMKCSYGVTEKQDSQFVNWFLKNGQFSIRNLSKYEICLFKIISLLDESKIQVTKFASK
jgi:hypothetical protein